MKFKIFKHQYVQYAFSLSLLLSPGLTFAANTSLAPKAVEAPATTAVSTITNNPTQGLFQEQNTLMGQDLTITQTYETTPAQQGVAATTRLNLLGHMKYIVDANVNAIFPSSSPSASPTPAGIPLGGETDLYIGGVRVWNGQLTYTNGSFVYAGGVAPTQIPFPLLMYPVGPLMLEVDAGVNFQGQLSASVTPGLSYPLTDSTVTAALTASATAAGYIEAYAQLLIIRAGVGGSVTVIDGDAQAAANIFMTKVPPQLTYGGKLTVLSGHIYGFVDGKIIFGSWNRWWSHDFFNWPGKCWAFGGQTCGTN